MVTERDYIDHYTHMVLSAYSENQGAFVRREVQLSYASLDAETAERFRWLVTGMADAFAALHAEWGILGTQIEYVMLAAAARRQTAGMPLAPRAVFEISRHVAESFTVECEGRDAVRQMQRKPISDHSL